ncbi:hypothetical protein SBA7_1610003 [Candidatus Sulfotelmatobacter sp. SbA7]|nr:hypothetical protein SBA7_1610003 [Candidatus Sulfotelmatobacter sp. SbA7]
MNGGSTKFFVLVSYLCLFALACNNRRESVKNIPPDFTGFWKWRCSDDWGVQIKKQTGNLFSVSFCGPGGCFEPGTWMPNTPIVGDPQYHYINPTTLAIQHGDGWQTLTKCTTNTNPVLDYSTMPSQSPDTKELGTTHAQAVGGTRKIVLPNPQLIHCRSAECSQLWKQDSGDGGAVYPAQVLTDFVNGEVVGLTAVYDKSVSTQELRAAIDTLYGKWTFDLHGSKLFIWRVEPEKLAVQLTDRDDGTKLVIYLDFGTYGSHMPSAHIDPSAQTDCGK